MRKYRSFFLTWVRKKKSTLGVIKSFLQLKNDVRINTEQYNAEIDEALSQVNEGDFLTHEEVKRHEMLN